MKSCAASNATLIWQKPGCSSINDDIDVPSSLRPSETPCNVVSKVKALLSVELRLHPAKHLVFPQRRPNGCLDKSQGFESGSRPMPGGLSCFELLHDSV